MKLYLVIYIAGHMAGYAGPLPYGGDECLSRQAGITQEWDRDWETRHLSTSPIMIKDGKRLTRADFKTACEFHAQRPAVEGPIYNLSPKGDHK